MLKKSLLIVVALLATPWVSKAQKAPTGPCGKDNVCAELRITDTLASSAITGDSGAFSVYRDYRAAGGDLCVNAEFRTRYSLLAVNISRDQQGACAGARAVTLMLPSEVCSHLTSAQAGYSDGDGHYTVLNGGCSLELRTTNPRVQVSGFVPDAVNPRAGDVYLPFNNPHYTGSGSVTFSSFALELVDAPSATPNGTNSTKVAYSQAAILNTYVNGRLDRKKALTFEPFVLEFVINLIP